MSSRSGPVPGVVGLVWKVIRIDGGPGQLSAVTTANAVGLLLPAMLGGVVADRLDVRPSEPETVDA